MRKIWSKALCAYSVLLNSVGGGTLHFSVLLPWGAVTIRRGTLQFLKFCRLLDIFKGSYLLNYWTSIPHLFTKILTLMYSSNMLGCVRLKISGSSIQRIRLGGGHYRFLTYCFLGTLFRMGTLFSSTEYGLKFQKI